MTSAATPSSKWGCRRIATLVAPVASSAVAFAVEPDYLYIGITLDVFVILLHSLLLA